MKPARPNILLLVSDQQRGDSLGADAQAPACLQTPNLDDLAAGGARFSRAYSECPTCAPARRTIFSGLAPAAHGMVGMTNLDFDVPAKLPLLLRDAGYQTELVGKLHLFPATARHGFEHLCHADASRGDWGSCRYTESLMARGHLVMRPGTGHGIDSNSWAGRPSHLPEDASHSYWCVSQALDFLEHRDRTCPFFLNVGFIDPHPPFTPPAFYYDRYIGAELPAPAIGDWAAADRPPPQQGRSISASRIDLPPAARRSSLAGYYGLVNHVDSQVGRLLQYLRDRKLFDDTLILFVSDHGDMLGDHYRGQKARPFEGSARVPLLIRPPRAWGLAPVVSAAPVGLQDILPTLLDAAAIGAPESCTGGSLLPLVRGEDSGPREILHGEHCDQYGHDEGMHYLTDGRCKYIWYTADGRELFFDLTADPGECRDLSADTEALRPWRQQLVELLRARPEGFVAGDALVPGRPYGKIVPGREPGEILPFL